MKLFNCFFLILIVPQLFSCGTTADYNLNGGNLGNAKTFKINNFQNYAARNKGSTFEPGSHLEFTKMLQNKIQNQTKLELVNTSKSDLVYEGEITEYRITPVSSTAQQTTEQNRLSIGIQLRFTNNTKEETDFEQRFSFFFDFPANKHLNSIKTEAHEVIFERITQDIFNATLANW